MYEDKAAYDDQARVSSIGSTTVAKPNYLEQIAQELSRQREIINILDDRLSIVSERNPQEPLEQPTDRIHVASLVGIVRRHNRDLERILNELAI